LTIDLFAGVPDVRPSQELMAERAVLLRGFARPVESDLIAALRDVAEQAPFRHMLTPGGHQMSVAMTNCGSVGWVTDPNGYRYDGFDPCSAKLWPAMPPSFRELAARAADRAGFDGFSPDACLINRYRPGARMSLHQDKDETDFGAPIVSVSLGLPAIAATNRAGFGWSMVTSRCGVGRRGLSFTASHRSRTASMPCWAGSASI
jgi:alkylated DNA repair protein (DNA oxidative demethylase)